MNGRKGGNIVKRIVVVGLLFLLFLSACSSNEPTPNERFNQFISLWNEQSYDEMYDFLSTDAKEVYPKEDATDRQQKVYEDLNVANLEVTAKELSDDEIKQALETGEATIPFSVSMETIAGEVSFDYEATLVQETLDDEETNWFVEWNPGFIFPELKDGGKLNVQEHEPKRGEILDRNQMPLAINDTVHEIGIIPANFNIEQSGDEVARLLGISEESIETALHADWVQPDLFVPLKTINDEKKVAELLAIDGITARDTTGRIYPAGEAAAHLVGYIRPVTAEDLEEHPEYEESDMIGSRGLEQLYEEKLRGEKGYTITVTNPDEEEIVLAEKPVQDGENIMVTIDINIQEKIYDTYDGDAGTAAAIDPKTGETLALVSSPAFNPNDILYGDASIWEKLEENKKEPLLNRFAATYAPGSVFKPITAAIGMKQGTLDPNEGLTIEGLTWSNGEGWGNYEVRRVSTSNGPVDLKDALVRSDNIYFAMQAVKMGADAYIEGLHEFGFGEDLPYEYPITASTISTSGELDNEVLLANTSYGQGEVEMSALHLAASYTIFLNEGKMIKPTLLTTEDTAQVWQENLITKEQAKIIDDALEAVVEDGTGKAAQKADVQISGKTGTAELKLTAGEDGEENGWFVGYPTDKQNILIAMMVEQTQDRGGSSYTTEKFVDIINDLK